MEDLSCSPTCVHHTLCKHFFQKRPCMPECASTLYPPSRWKHSHHVPLLFKRLCQSRRRRSKPPTSSVWMINDGSAHMPVIWKYSIGDGCQKRYCPSTSCGGKCCTRNSVCGTMANGVVLSGTNVHSHPFLQKKRQWLTANIPTICAGSCNWGTVGGCCKKTRRAL